MKNICRIFTAGIVCALITVGASGLTACKNNEKEYSVLDIYNAYQDDAGSYGKTAESYDSWIARMGITDEDAVVSVIDTDEDERAINVTYKDGSTASYPLPAVYTVIATAANQNNSGVANVYFSLYYTATEMQEITKDGVTENTEVEVNRVVDTVGTDDGGKALFYFFYDEDEYHVKLADSDDITDGSSNIPEKYSAYGFVSDGSYAQVVTVSKSGGAEYSLKYTANALLNNFEVISYSRYYNLASTVKTEDVDEDDIHEDYTPYTGTVEAYTYKYLQFNPYVSYGVNIVATSSSSKDEQLAAQADANARNALAKKAASGMYRITLTASSDSAVMYMYTYPYSSLMLPAYQNDDGTPNAIDSITGTAPSDTTYDSSLYTGTDYIELNYDTYTAGSNRIFGIVCSEDCEITVTVERTGEADEPEYTEYTVPCTTTEEFTDTLSNAILAPVDGSVEAVLCDDGYYHFVNADGPIIYVQLLNVVSRYNSTYPVSTVDSSAGMSRVLYEYDLNNRPVACYDYGDFIKAYADLANSQGLYPVNEELQNFLEIFKAESGEYSWLLPCYYEETDSGLPVEGSGTYADPYILHLGKNTVASDSSGTTYFTYTNTAGIYLFASNDKPLSIVGNYNLQTYLDGRSRTVVYSEETTERYSVDSTGTIIITVSEVTYTDTANLASGEGTVDSPYVVTVTDAMNLLVTDESYETDGVYITLKASEIGSVGELGIGNSYIVNVGFIRYDGSSEMYAGAEIIYNGTTYRGSELILTFNKGDEFELYIAPGTASYLMIMLIDYEDGDDTSYVDNSDSVSLDLSTGENSVKLDDINLDYNYYFTAAEDGWYRFDTETGIWITVDSVQIVNPSDSTIPNIVYVRRGETITVVIRANEDAGSGAHTVTITGITEEQAAGIKHTAEIGEQYTITLNANEGYRFYVTCDAAGSYVITVTDSTSNQTYVATVNTDINRTDFDENSADGTYTATVNLNSGENYIVISAGQYNEEAELTVTITAAN